MPLPLTDIDRKIDDKGLPAPEEARGLQPVEQAIVDEAFLRGATIDQALGVLITRSLPRSDIGTPAYRLSPGSPTDPAPGGWPRAPTSVPTRVLHGYGERLIARGPWEAKTELAATGRRIEALLPLVERRRAAYVAFVQRQFESLDDSVKRQFEPMRIKPHVDPYATPEEKYHAMRPAYYRAGWPFIEQDIFMKIRPATFFGAPVIGGAHDDLKSLLTRVEASIRGKQPQLTSDVVFHVGGSTLGGFVPRFQAGSSELSNHAYGLAIDLEPDWNPQFKDKNVLAALKLATGEDMGQLLREYSDTTPSIAEIYGKILRASEAMKKWLRNTWQQHEQLQEERAKLRKEKHRDKELAGLAREERKNPNLGALSVLIAAYTERVVRGWQTRGLVSIPPGLIEKFVALGVDNQARWGGQYGQSKDIMHLELLRLDPAKHKKSPPTRRPRVDGLGDLCGPNPRLPMNGPP